MDHDQRSDLEQDGAYPYNNYYSTGGPYRPPKKPRNYGWLLAVLGTFLLCIAGSMMLRQYTSEPADQVEPLSTAQSPEETGAGTAGAG